MTFYELRPIWRPRPELDVLAHGLIACPAWGLKGDPDISYLSPETRILMRTGPFFPSLAMASSRILYCPKIFMEIFSQKFPEVSFEIFPTGRIVDLDWQSWPEDEFPNWINEIEDYIICNPHSESLSQKIGNFYRIVIPFGARVSYFRIAPENREGMSDNLKMREIHDSYGAIDRNTWNGMPIFTAQNNVILLSEIGVKIFQKFGLEDLFEFEEYLDKDTWYEKRIE